VSGLILHIASLLDLEAGERREGSAVRSEGHPPQDLGLLEEQGKHLPLIIQGGEIFHDRL
jgi:hypothetical protein